MKKLVSITIMALLLASAVASLNAASAQGYQAKKIWGIPMATNDVALSKDGKYVAAVNNTGLYYFPSNSSTPNWWYLSNATASEWFLSVAISANGQYVIVGNNTFPTSGPKTDSIYYFGNSTTRSGQQASNSYNWTSSHFISGFSLGLNVERGSIDISANGQYVVVGGTGDDVYYFSDCASKSGANQPWDWVDGHSYYHVTTVDMSPDGNYIAVGGPGFSSEGFVAFFVNATNAQHQWKWSNNSLDGIIDVEVSDDGFAVAAVSVGIVDTLYYWVNAPSLSGTLSVAATWIREHEFTSVDISSDGNRVVAGYEQLDIASLHYWDNAKTRTGTDEPETWIDLQTLEVRDVAISNDGSIIAATTYNTTSNQAEVYFFTSSDTYIASFALTSQDDFILSMSGDGHTVAVGGGTFDSLSLYSFEATTGIPVGGYDAAPNYLAVLFGLLGPWTIAVAASAAIIAVAVKKAKTRVQIEK